VIALQQYATYVRIISYFLDDPSPLAPFSVHRMALIGKALGKEVGEWFGPSTAQGALRTLANAFPPCGLTVVGGTDGTIYRSEVYEASHADDGEWATYVADQPPSADSKKAKRTSRMEPDDKKWGKKAVLVLVGLRLGLDGVNPIYHDSIKVSLFTSANTVLMTRPCLHSLNQSVLPADAHRRHTISSPARPIRSSTWTHTLHGRPYHSRYRQHSCHRPLCPSARRLRICRDGRLNRRHFWPTKTTYSHRP
jgi:hypothetical protein